MSLYSQIRANKQKSVLIVAGFIAFVIAFGAVLGIAAWDDWIIGTIVAALIAAVYIPLMLASSTRVIMAMNGAREIKSEDDNPFLWNTVESLSIAARVPMPRIFVIESAQPNAFAAGLSPKSAAVAATTGLLERLSREEVEAVMAHEMAHIRNHDVRLATIAIALVAVVAVLGDIALRSQIYGGNRRNRDNRNNHLVLIMVLLAILGPIVATLVQLALSRNREYLADADGAEICRNPGALARALEKIAGIDEPMEHVSNASASLYFSDPLKKKRSRGSLFATHPPTEKRIERLKAMLGG